MNNDQIAELLLERQIVEPARMKEVLQEANLNGKTLAKTITDSGLLNERGFYETVAEALGTDFIDLARYEIPPEVLRLIPSGLA